MKKVLLTIISIILFGGFVYWGLQPPQHTAEEWKEISLTEGKKCLTKFVKQHNLNESTFTGPYIRENDYSIDKTTYNTYFKNKDYHVYYRQIVHQCASYKLSEVDCNSSQCKWLRDQP